MPGTTWSGSVGPATNTDTKREDEMMTCRALVAFLMASLMGACSGAVRDPAGDLKLADAVFARQGSILFGDTFRSAGCDPDGMYYGESFQTACMAGTERGLVRALCSQTKCWSWNTEGLCDGRIR